MKFKIMAAIEGQRNSYRSPLIGEENNKFMDNFSNDLLCCANDQNAILRCVRDRINAIQTRLNEFKKASQMIALQNQTMNIIVRKVAEWLKELGIVDDPHSICSILTKELGDLGHVVRLEMHLAKNLRVLAIAKMPKNKRRMQDKRRKR